MSSVLSLHEHQAAVHRSPARFKTLVAGRRFGKTTLSKVSLIERAAASKGRNVWYVAPTYGMAKRLMWDAIKSALPRPWIKKKDETALTLKLANDAQISLKGSDQPDSLRGDGLAHVVLDEFQDMRPEVWTSVVRPMLARDRGSALFIGTPKSFNHLYEAYDRGQRGVGNWASWQFPTIMSPFIPKDEIEAARADLDERTFRQEFEASFESMSGQVYYAFDRKKHVGKYPFNPDLPVWVGQDFNIDPMASVILQPQPSGEVWLVDEIVMFSSNVTEVCDEIERRYWRQIAQNKVIIFPDPAGASRQHARGESSLDIFRERGFENIYYHKKHPPVQDRINAVNSALQAANGDITLRVNEACTNSIDSLEQTVYKPGRPDVDKTKGKEHITDALGYPIHKIFSSRQILVGGVKI